MVTEHPLEDRCGAQVVDKIGLHIHANELTSDDTDGDIAIKSDAVLTSDEDEYTYLLTDHDIDSVELVHPEEGFVKSMDPEYKPVVAQLRDGFNTNLVTTGGGVEIIVQDDDPYVTNRGTELEGYCERHPMDNGRCYNHGGTRPGPGEGNTNSIKHGLYAQRSNYYKSLDEEDKEFVEATVDSWIENAPFDRDNVAKVNRLYKVAIDEHKQWRANDYFADNDLITEDTIDIDGEQVIIEDEHPANLMYDRMSRTSLRELKELGCLDDDDADAEEAAKSLVQMLSDG